MGWQNTSAMFWNFVLSFVPSQQFHKWIDAYWWSTLFLDTMYAHDLIPSIICQCLKFIHVIHNFIVKTVDVLEENSDNDE